MKEDRQILATQSLYHLCAGLDMTRQESWDAVVKVADLLAEQAPDMTADVLLEIDKKYGGMKNGRNH